MLDVMLQSPGWDGILPHVDTTHYTHVYKHVRRLPSGMGFPLFVVLALMVWFGFLALIGAFKK